MKTLKTFLTAFALSTMVLTIPTTSQALDAASVLRPIVVKLALFESLTGNDGWHRSHDRKVNGLRQGQSRIYHFNLDKDQHYKIMSTCDADCSDLDLSLYDDNDNEISVDFSGDGTPIVEVAPRWSGHYRLKVTMYHCNRNPCFYGVTTMAHPH